MKLTKFVPLLLIIASLFVIIWLSTTSVAIQGSSAAQIPEAIKLAVNAGLGVLLTAGTVWVFEKSGLDLRQFAVPISAIIATFVITEVQDIINIVDESYDLIINVAFQIIVVLLGTIGFLRLRKAPPPEDARLL